MNFSRLFYYIMLCHAVFQMWYSFDIGFAHIVSYSTEVYFTYDQAYVANQYDWLQQNLERANR